MSQYTVDRIQQEILIYSLSNRTTQQKKVWTLLESSHMADFLTDVEKRSEYPGSKHKVSCVLQPH